jgi:hypothetical protein
MTPTHKNVTREPENNSTATAAPDELAHLERVVDILKSLVRLIHGRKLYAENNPRLQEFEEGLAEGLARYFEVEDELVLGVDQYAIRWREELVYENEKREESIAFLLHKDGIGEISVGAGAVGDEMNHLVQILTDEFHRTAPDEDVVTRFWNADFEHISYRVLDDYLAGDYSELAELADPEEVPTEDHEELSPSLADRGREIMSPRDQAESIDVYLRRLIMRTCESEDETEREEYFQKLVGSFFTVSNDELALYHAEVRREQEEDTMADFADAILVFTLLEDNPSAVRDVCGVVERIVEYAVDECVPTTVTRLMRILSRFRSEHRLPDSIVEYCARLESQLTATRLVDKLGEMMGRGEDAGEILEYFRLLGDRATDQLLRILHHVEGRKLHRDICDALIDVAGGDVPHILERMDIDNPEIASDAVYIAGRMDPPQLTTRIQELLFYPDRKVKEEVITLITRTGDPATVELLLGVIADEDKNVRCRAMEAAADIGDERVRDRLEEIAFGKDLPERETDEQEVLFRALGRVGDANTVAALTRFVDKKSFRNLGRSRENKFLAIRALEGIRLPSALLTLDKLSEDSNNLVHSRARRARDVLAAALENEEAPA